VAFPSLEPLGLSVQQTNAVMGQDLSCRRLLIDSPEVLRLLLHR